jgi:rhodanese-related sulfurtransferase
MRNANSVLKEAALVAAIGLALALAANTVSPRGLRLNRDYFPNAGTSPAPAQNGATATAPSPHSPADALQATVKRLEQHGLQVITSNGVAESFADPRYEQGLIVLIDARDDEHYQKGHIPGAWQFDHYHAEQYLPTILPICMSAQKIVVYCNGGACEDSEFATIMLRDAGVPRDLLYVYAGGITEWASSGQAVELGARRSGRMAKLKP